MQYDVLNSFQYMFMQIKYWESRGKWFGKICVISFEAKSDLVLKSCYLIFHDQWSIE